MLNKLKIIIHITTVLLVTPAFTFANDIEIRKIVPPNLEAAHLGEKILCYRPMRRGMPEMNVEIVGDKIIINNYGHGGSGWTLGPGTTNYVYALLINSPYAVELKKNSPITIVGAGVIGLYTAYNLHQQGYTNLTIIADSFDSLTSHNAGGLLAPVSMDNNQAIQKIIAQIGIDAYKFYDSIAKKMNPDFKDGAIIVPTYFEHREDSGLEPYVNKVMQPAKDVILDFGNGTLRKMVVYDDGIFIDTATMMNHLTSYLKNKGVKFKKKKIEKFAELEAKFIFNCSGLGAELLNNDHKMIPVQGHLIMLKDQKPDELQYMLLVYLGDGKTKTGQKITRSLYIFPKHLPNTGSNDIGVLGGTFVENATNATANTEEFDIIIQGAKKFYGIL